MGLLYHPNIGRAGDKGVISVATTDDKDRPTIFSRTGEGNRSCIDLYAPGGSLGRVVVGAQPFSNNSYMYGALIC